jgi:superfamily II DNA helicase RecQ
MAATGVLAGTPVDTILRTARAIVTAGLLEEYRREGRMGSYTAVRTTPMGEETLVTKSPVHLALASVPRGAGKRKAADPACGVANGSAANGSAANGSAANGSANNASETDAVLFARLRAVRLRLAHAADAPAYTIATDEALRTLIRVRPMTLDELRRVAFFTGERGRKHGAALLEALL